LFFVGRQHELALLTDCFAKAEAGHSRLVTLYGEAGIGKTRLADEFLAIAGQVARCFTGRAYPLEGTSPYGVWVEALHPYLRQLDPAMAHRIVGQTSILVRLFTGLAGAVQDVPDWPRFSPDEADHRQSLLFSAFHEMLGRLAATSPVVILLDDIHLADLASIELLHFLVRNLRGQRVMLLATFRTDECAESSRLASCLASLDRQGLVTQIPLGPLSLEETVQFVRQFMGERTVPQRTLTSLFDQTCGNPFYLREMLEHLSHHSPDPTIWDLAPGSTIPNSVSQLVTARAARLPDDARRLLAVVAVAGESASYPLLRAVSGFDGERLLTALDELRLSRFVREVPGDIEVRYDIDHPIVRGTIYQGLGAARRAHLHSLIGEAIIALIPPDRVPSAELARHLSASDHPSARRQALPHLLAAAERAIAVRANHEAASALRSALLVLGPADSSEEHRKVRVQLGEAYGRLGEFTKAIEVWQEAFAYVDGKEHAAMLHSRIARALWHLGDEEQSVHHLQVGLMKLGEDTVSIEAAELRQQLAFARQRLGDARAAIAEAERAISIAEGLGASEIAAKGYVVLQTAYAVLGRGRRASEYCQRALALSEKLDLPEVTWLALKTRSGVNRRRADWVAAEEDVRGGLEAAERMGAPALRSWPLSVLTEICLMTGDWDRGIGIGEQAIAIDRFFGQGWTLPRSLAFTAMVYRLRGDRHRAEAYLEEATSLVASLRRREVRIASLVLGMRAFFQLLDGEPYAALATSEGLLRDLDDRGGQELYLLDPLALPLAARGLCAGWGVRSGRGAPRTH